PLKYTTRKSNSDAPFIPIYSQKNHDKDAKLSIKHRYHTVLFLLFFSMLYTRRLSSVLMLSHNVWPVR
ncbi:hypothetical protein AB9D42_01445, partial [Klebsiella pneumoniae]|uniref:hypothetical protein n=1 Tax=Klebsiella pneumoniae TaxID=573 RepID=UPI00350F7ED3